MTGRGIRSAGSHVRLRVGLGVLCLLLVIVSARLVYLQVVAGPAFAEKAAAQRQRDIVLEPRRGTIYDREGEPLAVSIEAKDVYVAPHLVKRHAKVAAALASVLGGKASDYEAKLRRDSGFVYLARKVDVGRAKALADKKLPGVGFIDHSLRTYPSGELACQILGFVGVDDHGLSGIEKQYDTVLAGEPGRLIAERDPWGRPIPGGVTESEDPVDGRDLWLTIDKDVQYQAQLELARVVEEFDAKGGSVIIMDPRNGELLAMASTPTFDPNDFRSGSADAFRNRPVTDAYEPGSTIKAMTAAAVVDRKMYEPDSKFTLPPTLKIAGRTIHESHPRGTVRWSLTDIVTNSSNVGAVRLGQALGENGLYDYFARFGLTEKTGVDYPGEAKGWLPPVKQWSALSIANIPFGQGISVTPLQLARAMAAIANGGTLTTPHFLLRAEDGMTPETESRRAISSRTSKEMVDVLRAVVTEGTGGEAAVNGYEVAGKTGTAQKARENGVGYAAGKYIASFAGFLPAENPRVLIIVTIDEPSKAIYGGAVAAPAFSHLAQFTVSHLGLPPSIPSTKTGDSSSSSGDSDAGEGKETGRAMLESGDSSR